MILLCNTNIKTIIIIVDISYNIHCKKYDPINEKSLNEISQNYLLAIFDGVKLIIFETKKKSWIILKNSLTNLERVKLPMF